MTGQTGYQVFVMPSFRVAPHQVDELCALALHALGGRGVLKDKAGEPHLLFLLEE